MFFGIAVTDVPSYAQYRQAPAVYQHAPFAEGRPLPLFGGAGTGGVESLEFLVNRQGYRLVTFVRDETVTLEPTYEPYVDLMQEVQAGFGRTLSHLPAVFGVSRQALYNWMKGEIPKEQHRAKLVQLAEAAKVFTAAGVKPSAEMLERTVAKGKSFVGLLAVGANGREIAEKLVRIVKRGVAERENLDALLGDRTASSLSASDLGRQSFPDGA
jgi:hypothetical protein